jgi:SET domain-containing protein
VIYVWAWNMKKKLFQNKLCVKKSSTHGYGVFAEKDFKKGEKIEECYMLLTKAGDSTFEDYYFDAKRKYALLTGFGSIYNHSDDPNTDYTIDVKNKLATFKADKRIRKGEEIFISYGEEWFETREIKPKNK